MVSKMVKEKLTNFLKSRYILWVFAISVQVVYTILFWSFVSANNMFLLYLFGEIAIWVSFICMMSEIRSNLYRSFDMLSQKINEDEKLPHFEFGEKLNILARFQEVMHYILNCMEQLRIRLDETENKYRKYLRFGDISMDVNFEYDFKKDIIYLSGNYTQVFGEDSKVVLPAFKDFVRNSEFVHESQRLAFISYIDKACISQEMKEREWYLKKSDGKYEWFSIKISYLEGSKEENDRIIGIIRNVNLIKQEAVRLKEKVIREPMTNLYNRDAIVLMVNQSLDKLEQDKLGVLLMVDIDDFKTFNDTFGHLMGDKVILSVADALAHVFNGHAVSRIGGDEFSVFLVDQDCEEDVNSLVDEFIIRVHGIAQKLDLPLLVNVSVGIAVTNKPCRYNELYVKADNALYMAKGKGKNCYCWYDEKWALSKSESKSVMLDENISNILFQMLRMNRENTNLNKQLEYIGSIFNVSHISVLEIQNDKDTLGIYASYSEGIMQSHTTIPSVHVILSKYNFDKTGVYYSITQKEDMDRIPYRLVLVFQLHRESELLGFLNFVQTNEEFKIWTQSEIESLRLVADSIASHLYINKIQKENQSRMNDLSIQSEEQRKEQSDYFLQILAKTYMEIYEIDVETHAFKSLARLSSSCSSMVTYGDFERDILYRCEHVIVESERNRFLEFYDLERLLISFETGHANEQIEYQLYDENGNIHYVSSLIIPKSTDLKQLLVYIKNIDQRKKMALMEEEKRLLELRQEEDARYRVLAEQAGTYLFEWNKMTNKTYVDAKIKQRYAGNYDGRDIFKIWKEDGVIHNDDLDKLNIFMRPKEVGGLRTETIVRLKRSDSNEYAWCQLSLNKIRVGGEIQRILGTLNDISGEVKAHLEVSYQNHFDSLTGVFKIEKFVTYVSDVFREYPMGKFAIVVMDINRFKVVNDVYGWETGDNLLRHVASTIAKKLKIYDSLCRFNGDVFVLFLQYTNVEDIVNLIRDVSAEISDNFLDYKVTLGYGVYLIQDISLSIMQMIDMASLALKTVKGSYIQNFAFYDDRLRQQILQEDELENEMMQALNDGMFKMYLQPKVNMKTNVLQGAEALIRWEHPERGRIYPDVFLPLFEKNGFVVEIDRYIWKEACKQLQKWQQAGEPMIPISVNISRMNIYRPDFYDYIIQLAKEYDIPHRYLELELTESVFLEHPEELYVQLQRLRDLGFRLSLDDFGSGYSSLGMLKDVPIDVLKIDRTFLMETVNTEKGQTIIKFVVCLANKLNLEVVAEGVENLEQIAFLKECGCAIAQGYYYSKPISVDEFEQFKKNIEKESS